MEEKERYELFGISRQAVWKWRKAKKLKVIRLGKLYRIPVSEVERIKIGELWIE